VATGWFVSGIRGELRRESLIRFAGAVTIMAAAFVVAAALRAHVGGAVFAPIFAGLALSVWFGGVGPGVLALLLSIPLTRFFLLSPLYSFDIQNQTTGWIVFALTAGVIVALGASLHRGRQAEADARRTAERESRRAEATSIELRELQRLTALLSDARAPAEVADVVLTSGLTALGARCGAVLVYDSESEMLMIERAIGYPPGALDSFQTIPIDADVPIAVAARTRRPILLHNPAEIAARFPLMVGVFRQVGAAGAALPLLADGAVVGGIVLVFTEKQAFSPPQLDGLRAFATVCGRVLQRATQHQTDHDVSVLLQRSLLPGSLPTIPGVELAARYVPATASADVGGDWYDAAIQPNGRLAVSVGDVVGKGVAAAALMGRLRIGLKAYAIDGYSPAEVVARLDRLSAQLPEMEYTTLVVASLDLATGVLLLCRAGHMPPLLVPRAAPPRLVMEGASGPVGLSGSMREQATVLMAPGDAFVLFTDGLVERRGQPLDLGLAQLSDAVRESTPASAESIADAALAASPLNEDSPADDIALLVVRYATQ
jgi:Stage II sporulation protein E (SpoIIE)/GAF domain/Domain of unknown function (DUF4118)